MYMFGILQRLYILRYIVGRRMEYTIFQVIMRYQISNWLNCV